LSKENTEIAAQGSGFLALAGGGFSKVVSGELDGLDIAFERIKIPSGGATVFELPGEGDEAESVKEFSAVILYHQTLNAFYKTKYTGGSNPPDCGSTDGITGEGDPGGNCKQCPHNKFGSGENGSKACKNRRRLYVLREGEMFPMLLSLPTGSLKPFARYLQTVLSKGRASNAVVTRFSLKKAVNKGGIAYSQAVFALDRVLSHEERAAVQPLTGHVKEYAMCVGFEDDAVTVDMETGEVIGPAGADV
jgi:hypothetical protein